MIRHDRGFSIINSSESDGIPSPIRENDSFKKLFDFKDSEPTSKLNSRKVKIEFSDTMTKGKSKKKEEVDKSKHADFTYSSIDQMIFAANSQNDLDAHGHDNGSIAETVKHSDSKAQLSHSKVGESKENTEPENDKSFDYPPELSRELKQYSLRSSVDYKFYAENRGHDIDEAEIEVPSINNSIVDYPQIKQIGGKMMYENSEIQNQDSVSHRDGSVLKQRKSHQENNEKKATKKEFEDGRKIPQDAELDQDEIDRHSTVKKVILMLFIKILFRLNSKTQSDKVYKTKKTHNSNPVYTKI